ncbi:MAG: aldose 1-epimerase family protein [Erysipelotrichaceae bacterium]|nr:aldose 1-epimerase family protein [Erysipelotrichaceae bacterium]
MNIENSRYRLEVTNKAAEITSFYDKEKNVEYMWNGDPTYWAGRNPILFPMVGNTYSKEYYIDGKRYAMGNHGLARHATFEKVAETENSLTLEFCSDEETLKQYPFDFSLKVTYTLVENRVNIDYVIKNTGDKVMPFSFGLHPAFNCNNFDEYYLELPQEERLNVFNWSNLTFEEQQEMTKRIPLSYDTLPATIILENCKAPYVNLTNGEHGVEVGCAGYRWLAFWTKPNAPYVCIEPWHGLSDFAPNNLPFEERLGTMLLDPNKEYRTSYYFRVY